MGCMANNEQRAYGDGGYGRVGAGEGRWAVVAGILVSQPLRIPSSEKTLAICGNTRTEIGTFWFRW